MAIALLNNMYYCLLINFKDFSLIFFIMANVHINIKTIYYIIFHYDIYEYVECKLRILLCIIFI